MATTRKVDRAALVAIATFPIALLLFYKFPESIFGKALLIVVTIILIPARFYSYYISVSQEQPAKTRVLGVSNL